MSTFRSQRQQTAALPTPGWTSLPVSGHQSRYKQKYKGLGDGYIAVPTREDPTRRSSVLRNALSCAVQTLCRKENASVSGVERFSLNVLCKRYELLHFHHCNAGGRRKTVAEPAAGRTFTSSPLCFFNNFFSWPKSSASACLEWHRRADMSRLDYNTSGGLKTTVRSTSDLACALSSSLVRQDALSRTPRLSRVPNMLSMG